MRYFVVRTDMDYTDAPEVINWYKDIDVRDIEAGRSHKIQQRSIFSINSNKDVIFTDILSTPFFLVTDLLEKVIKLYEPRTIFKQVVLLDSENEKVNLYHLPILKKVDCLMEESTCNLDKSVITNFVLDYSKIKDNSIFQIANVNGIYTVVRLDILESFLRRGAKGLSIQEVELYLSEKGAENINE